MAFEVDSNISIRENGKAFLNYYQDIFSIHPEYVVFELGGQAAERVAFKGLIQPEDKQEFYGGILEGYREL
jgi:hypothetical protein